MNSEQEILFDAIADWKSNDDWQFADKEAAWKFFFQAGAASRDAEVVSLTNQRDYEYVRAENAEQERDQLRAEINVLREALEYCVTQVGELATVPGIASALSSTPEQSLAEYRNKVIEAFVNEFSRHVGGDGEFWLHELQDFAMKEQP